MARVHLHRPVWCACGAGRLGCGGDEARLQPVQHRVSGLGARHLGPGDVDSRPVGAGEPGQLRPGGQPQALPPGGRVGGRGEGPHRDRADPGHGVEEFVVEGGHRPGVDQQQPLAQRRDRPAGPDELHQVVVPGHRVVDGVEQGAAGAPDGGLPAGGCREPPAGRVEVVAAAPGPKHVGSVADVAEQQSCDPFGGGHPASGTLLVVAVLEMVRDRGEPRFRAGRAQHREDAERQRTPPPRVALGQHLREFGLHPPVHAPQSGELDARADATARIGRGSGAARDGLGDGPAGGGPADDEFHSRERVVGPPPLDGVDHIVEEVAPPVGDAHRQAGAVAGRPGAGRLAGLD